MFHQEDHTLAPVGVQADAGEEGDDDSEARVLFGPDGGEEKEDVERVDEENDDWDDIIHFLFTDDGDEGGKEKEDSGAVRGGQREKEPEVVAGDLGGSPGRPPLPPPEARFERVRRPRPPDAETGGGTTCATQPSND